MQSQKSTIAILLITVLILILASIIAFFPHRIASNPEGTIGNTAGNLNNEGLFCEDNGVIYFANAYDNGSLYSMNADGSNINKLANASIKYINAAGKYLYFYQTSSSASGGLGSIRNVSGIYRSRKTGDSFKCMNRDPSGILNLIGDYLYYQHYDVTNGMTFYRTRTDKRNQTELADYVVNPASVQNGLIYYNGVEKDHYLYTFNTANDSTSLVWSYDIWNPVAQGEYIYYMDVHNNYALCRYNMNTQETQTLTTDRIDYFNVLNNVIFYQISSTDAPMLMRMNIDGSNIETVAEGVFEKINLTSQYAYFSEYDSPIPVYMTSTTGPINITTFDAARDASLQDSK